MCTCKPRYTGDGRNCTASGTVNSLKNVQKSILPHSDMYGSWMKRRKPVSNVRRKCRCRRKPCSANTRIYTFNHPDANADASVNARNEKFFIFLSLYLHLHTLLTLVSPGNANANARRKNTGSIDSMPPRHSSNQEDVEVFRRFGNFLYFPTKFFFSCTSKHIKTTNILVLYRGILREKIPCASSKIQTFDLSAGSASDTILCSRWLMLAKSLNKIYVKKSRQHNRIIPRVIHALCWD